MLTIAVGFSATLHGLGLQRRHPACLPLSSLVLYKPVIARSAGNPQASMTARKLGYTPWPSISPCTRNEIKLGYGTRQVKSSTTCNGHFGRVGYGSAAAVWLATALGAYAVS